MLGYPAKCLPCLLCLLCTCAFTLQIDEMDYERRMAAYSELTADTWQAFSQRQAAPLLHHCLHDLRNAGGTPYIALGWACRSCCSC